MVKKTASTTTGVISSHFLMGVILVLGFSLSITTPLGFNLVPQSLAAKPQAKKYSQRKGQEKDQNWRIKFHHELNKILKNAEGEFGFFIKDLTTGQVYTRNSAHLWYYASAIKLFVLIELHRQALKGIINLKQKVTYTRADYRDGAGSNRWLSTRSGTKVSVQSLMRRMMLDSDNGATDLLIKLVGIQEINRTIQKIAPFGIGRITSLLDVRRIAFSQLHPKAYDLGPQDFRKIKYTPLRKRLKKVSKLLKIPLKDFYIKNLNEGFEHYYVKGYNSGSIHVYSYLLEELAGGRIISPKVSTDILRLMEKCKTGKTRIWSGLNRNRYRFAHKTGTQHRRLCDMGVITSLASGKRVVIGACAKQFNSLKKADKVIGKMSRALVRSGVFTHYR